jgi:nucleoredoxin
MKMLNRQHATVAAIILGAGLCVSCNEQPETATPVQPEKAEAAAPVAEPETAPATPEAVSEPAPAVEDVAATPAPAWLKEYFGDELVKADGSTVSVDTLAGKTIAIYFSAHWCPPCRGFTPVLVKTYNEMIKDGKPFEVVFASSDRSKDAMAGYMTEMSMPWVAIPFGSKYKGQLGKKYGIRGIPSLVVIDSNGELITKNGRGDVGSKGAAAFDSWTK